MHTKWKADAEATQDNSKWQRLYSMNQFHYACKQSSLNKCTNLQILICSMHQQQHNDRQYDYATKTRAHLYPTTRQDNVKAQSTNQYFNDASVVLVNKNINYL